MIEEKVSIAVPVVRPEGFNRLVESIKIYSGLPEENYEIVHIVDVNREGGAKTFNKCVELTKYELVCFLADDTILEKDCIKNAVKAMRLLPEGWGMVGIYDRKGGGLGKVNHYLLSKKLLPLLGGKFIYEGYKYICGDAELRERCMVLGKYIACENAVVIHNHPKVNNSIVDEERKRVATTENIEHDRELLCKRRSLSCTWTKTDLLEN